MLYEVITKVVEATDKEPVIVNIDAAGNFYINYGENQDKPIAAKDLVNRTA